MTGYDDFNYPAFEVEAQRLRALGYKVLSPHEQVLDEGKTWEDYMRVDIPLVCQADLIATLPGWTESRGAMLECFIGRQLGIRIVPSESLQERVAR